MLVIFPNSIKVDAKRLDDFFTDNVKTKDEEFLNSMVQFYKRGNEFPRFLSKLITTASFLHELCFENPSVTNFDGERFPLSEDAVSHGAFTEVISYIEVLHRVLSSPLTPSLTLMGILDFVKNVYAGEKHRIYGSLDALLASVDKVMKTLFYRYA